MLNFYNPAPDTQNANTRFGDSHLYFGVRKTARNIPERCY